MTLNIREVILALLGVRCVFPSTLNPEKFDLALARCMLEYSSDHDKLVNYDDSTEDILARIKTLSKDGNENAVKVRT